MVTCRLWTAGTSLKLFTLLDEAGVGHSWWFSLSPTLWKTLQDLFIFHPIYRDKCLFPKELLAAALAPIHPPLHHDTCDKPKPDHPAPQLVKSPSLKRLLQPGELITEQKVRSKSPR